jgi:hypothetical protein
VQNGGRGLKTAVKRLLDRDFCFFTFAALGALCGALPPLLFSRSPEAEAFAGGFAHAFPADFSPKQLALAIFFQALPMLVIYYSGFGVLVRESSAAVIFIRAFFAGYCTVLASELGDLKDPLFLLLLLFFILFELLTVSFHASFAHLARAFSRGILKKRSKKAIRSFTADLLFFYGLILFFYIARGFAVALMNL